MKFSEKNFKYVTFDQLLVAETGLTEEELIELKTVARVEYEKNPRNMEKIRFSRFFVNFIVGAGKLTENQVAQIYSKQYSLPFIDLKNVTFQRELIEKVGQKKIEKYRVIPLEEKEDGLLIGLADPGDFRIQDELKTELNCRLEFAVCSESLLNQRIGALFESSASLRDSIDQIDLFLIRDSEDSRNLQLDDSDEQTDLSPVIRIINRIVMDAVNRRASDIHFEIYEENVKVRFRVDGVLSSSTELDNKLKNLVVSRIKVMAELDIAEKQIPQDGRFKLIIKDRNVDFRVSTLPTVYGESVVIRILDRKSMSFNILNLGFNTSDLERFSRIIRAPYGMILVSGPTGSGKTTTLYSAIREIHSDEVKIITIEDPVEYLLDGVVQVPVNEKKGLTFSSGLRTIVRQDPDKIMIGEIRDIETAEIAINAALTGHLVLSTIHSNNVIDTIGRLMNFGIDPYLFASAFNAILAQRLVRTICKNCKEVSFPDFTQYRYMPDAGEFQNKTLYMGRGCPMCAFTGYLGRTGIYELLELEDNVKEMIISRLSPFEVRKLAMQNGMISLREDCRNKVLEGITTIEEMNRVTFY